MTSIWRRPGLDEDQFYAALYYLSVVQRQQKAEDKRRSFYQKFPEDNTIEIPRDVSPLLQDNVQFINSFLDRLALLFARFRTKATPENVTATALYEGGGLWNIVVAKNNGLDSKDEECGRRLSEWWVCDAEKSPLDGDPGPGNQAWEYLKDFWSDRIKHYVRNVMKTLPRLNSGDVDPCFQDAIDVAKAIVSDQEHMHGKIDTISMAGSDKPGRGSQKNQPSSGRINLPFSIFERCYNFRLQRNLQKTPEKLDLQLGKVVHYIEMLGMMKSIWNSLVGFRKLLSRKGQKNLSLGFLEAPVASKLEKDGLYNTIEKWDGGQCFTEEKEKTVLRTLVAGKAQGTDTQVGISHGAFSKYFHCELQILAHLWIERMAHNYIGVSKLSCYLCWMVLGQQSCPFKTRGGHGQISANCQIPLSSEDAPSLQGIFLDALLTAQGQMLFKVNIATLGLEDSIERPENRLQTDFAPSFHYSRELSKEVSINPGEVSVKPRRARWASRNPHVSEDIKALHGSLAAGPDVQLQAITTEVVLSLDRHSWLVRGEEFFLSFGDWPPQIWLPKFAPASDGSPSTWGAVYHELDDRSLMQRSIGPIFVFLWFRFANIESLEVGDDIYLMAVAYHQSFLGTKWCPWCDISILEDYHLRPILEEWSNAKSRKALIRRTYEMKDEKVSMVWAKMNTKSGVLRWKEAPPAEESD